MQSPNVSRKLNLSALGKDIEVVFRVDNDRFIFPSNQHESPSKTIMFVGGSTTECSAVSESLRFPHYVSTLLRRMVKISIQSIWEGQAIPCTTLLIFSSIMLIYIGLIIW